MKRLWPPRRPRMPAARAGAAVRGSWLVIAVVAMVGAVAGGVLVVRDWATPAPLSAAATLGGLTAQLHDAGWLSMESHQATDQGGYQMPAQMMPGAPAGDDMRLGVPLTLVNTGGKARGFELAEEFFLGGGRNDVPRELHSDTFGQLPRLGPGSAVDGVLYFDTTVPGAADPPMYLLWKRAGTSVQLAIPRISEISHDHGS